MGARDARDWAGALGFWRSVLSEFPESASAQAFAGLARAHRELGEWAAAEEACSRGLALFPSHADLAIQAAETAALQRDWPRAVASWRTMPRSDRARSIISRQIAGALFRMLEDDHIDTFLEHQGALTPGLGERCRLALEGILQLRTENWSAAERVWDGYWAKLMSGEFDAGPIPIRDRPSAQGSFPVAEPRKLETYGALERPVCVYPHCSATTTA